ncbi:hypothetical protein D9613_011353 [Agrocybe pediades]|uniref:Cytochrome P450 n=1 Tax=Agrocybe pediades TaxID=84607 RepID=A0A8H4QRU0_9AGAR|nr:hypothetical protein D9613_011353 [Agrocybe pediades]
MRYLCLQRTNNSPTLVLHRPQMNLLVWNIVSIFSFLFLVYLVRWTLAYKRNNRPPGPRPLPLLGNLLDMPRKKEWETFAKWAKQYGEIVYVTIAGQPMIFLNTLDTATELLLERSAIYSDRPVFPLVDLLGHPDFNYAFMPYGKLWQARRRLFATQYTKSALAAHHDSYRTSALSMLRRFHHSPTEYVDHFRFYSARTMLDITYGIQITSTDNVIVKLVDTVVNTISLAVSPMMLVINPLPLLQALPRWLGGDNYSYHIQKWKQEVIDLQMKPFEKTKEQIAAGTIKPCLAGDLLQKMENKEDAEQEKLIRDCAVAAYGGGSDTATSSFMLAMLLRPEVQERAQKEIDAIVGSDRLPDLSDRSRLPFVTAIAKEVLRWHPPTPQGIPHMLTRDDVYKGYHLPAGSIIVGNIWGILHDPNLFEDPMAFKPERHLSTTSKLDDLSDEAVVKAELFHRVVFGFGRRVCPGQILAEDILWLVVAQFLAVYIITRDPNFPAPKAEFTSGAISQPVPFHYKLTFRTDYAKALIEQAE